MTVLESPDAVPALPWNVGAASLVELPAVGLVALEDAETGQVGYVDTAVASVRETYARAARERRAQRLRTFSRMGIDRVDLSTDRPYVPALLALFNARSRRN